MSRRSTRCRSSLWTTGEHFSFSCRVGLTHSVMSSHMNDAGYALMAQTIYKVVAPQLANQPK